MFKVYLQSTSKHIKVQQNAADRNCTWLPACAKASAQRGFNDCGSKAIHRRAASKAASHSLGKHSATFATSTNKQAQTGTNKTHKLPGQNDHGIAWQEENSAIPSMPMTCAQYPSESSNMFWPCPCLQKQEHTKEQQFLHHTMSPAHTVALSWSIFALYRCNLIRGKGVFQRRHTY